MKTTKKEWLYPLRNPENPSMVELVPVSESFYRAVYPEIWRIMQREIYHGRCGCPQKELWKCDADCQICKYHKTGDLLSLDYEIDLGDGTKEAVGSTIIDDGPTPFELLCEKELREALHAEIEKLRDPDKAIAKSILRTNSYILTSSELKIPESTVGWRWREKICPELQKRLKKYF